MKPVSTLADIDGSLDCLRGKFSNPQGDALNCDGAKIAGDMFLQEVFVSEGAVWFFGADIGGRLDCLRGKFSNPQGDALNFVGAKIAGDVRLQDGFVSEGVVSFSRARLIACSFINIWPASAIIALLLIAMLLFSGAGYWLWRIFFSLFVRYRYRP